MDNYGTLKQPDPIKTNRVSANDLLVDRLGLNHILTHDLQQRKRIGIETYGMTLTAFNGRNQVVDAYQELLDCLVYFQAKIEELEYSGQMGSLDYFFFRDNLRSLTFLASDLVAYLKIESIEKEQKLKEKQHSLFDFFSGGNKNGEI